MVVFLLWHHAVLYCDRVMNDGDCGCGSRPTREQRAFAWEVKSAEHSELFSLLILSRMY